jgi:hypothetical protein
LQESDGAKLRFEHQGSGLWVAVVPSIWGPVEFLASGTRDKPDDGELVLIESFLQNARNRILGLRKRIPWGFLYRPIRIAINNEKRMGIQFQHKLFSAKRQLILEDARPAAKRGKR